MFHYLYEVIVVLNGDIDTQYTDMILDIFAYKPAGLYCRLIKTDQAGVSNARNLGIDAAKGNILVSLMMMILSLLITLKNCVKYLLGI